MLLEIVEHFHRDIFVAQAKLNVGLRTIAVHGNVFDGHVHGSEIKIALVRNVGLESGANGGVRIGRTCLRHPFARAPAKIAAIRI